MRFHDHPDHSRYIAVTDIPGLEGGAMTLKIAATESNANTGIAISKVMPVLKAAPDLLAAAVALLKDWDAPDLNDATPIAERFDALRLAVAKAEGGR